MSGDEHLDDRRVVASLERLPPTRRALLIALKRQGSASADELATELGITVSAVRQHLAALGDAGLVTHDEVRAGPGRPRHAHRCTPAAVELFPRAYGELTTELLAYVEDEDPEMLGRMFERRRRRRVQRAATRMAGLDLAGQVRVLATVLDEDGYMAEAIEDADGGFRIVEHNCAILNVALRYGVACGTELEFIREVLPGAAVDRVQHLLAGSHVCAYAIRPR
ncbi:MAG: putative transcriptional regulator [Acidimicrobiales bacterium]|nr:putative transcriptional regulator [Acidimicrobiales bacterium]